MIACYSASRILASNASNCIVCNRTSSSRIWYISSGGSHHPWRAGKAPAVRLASGLLKAYGELRLLVPLLDSLAAALGSPKCPASASSVIQDPGFLEELRKVLPSLLFDAIMANIASSRAMMPEDRAQIMLRRPENPRCHAGSAGSSARATSSRSALCGCCSKVCCPGMDRRACPVCPDPAAAEHSDRYSLVRFRLHTTSM